MKTIFDTDNTRNSLINYYDQNMAGTLVLLLSAIMLSYSSDKKYIKSVISLIIVSFVTWYGHLSLHKYPNNPISKIHSWTHHSAFGKTFFGKFLEYSIVETFFFGGGLLLLFLMWFHRAFGYYILNPYVVFWWTLSVPIVHELYYHQTKKDNIHRLHHKNALHNLGPDIWDVVMKSKDNGEIIEDENTISIIMILWCLCIIPFIHSKYDFIQILSN